MCDRPETQRPAGELCRQAPRPWNRPWPKSCSPNDAPRGKTQENYARVQQIRNTSYEVRRPNRGKARQGEGRGQRRGRMETRVRRWHAADLALSRARPRGRIGSLRSVGLGTETVIFSTRGRWTGNKLDANVVLVKLNARTFTGDPGAAFTPFGFCCPGAKPVSRACGSIEKAGSWVRTALPDSSASASSGTPSSSCRTARAVWRQTYHHLHRSEAMQRRLEERNQDEATRKTFLEDQVKELSRCHRCRTHETNLTGAAPNRHWSPNMT